jgi:multiple sugar transport system permease protein
MASIPLTSARPIPSLEQTAARSRLRRFFSVGSYNILAWIVLGIYLLPVAFMLVTALKSTDQLSDNNAPWYPSKISTYTYLGQADPLYHVPTPQGLRTLALVQPGVSSSQFIDPKNPAAGLIAWNGDLLKLKSVYEPNLVWSNFTKLFTTLPFPRMVANTLLVVLIGEIGVLISSILIAYGFARFPLPGGDLLFYVVIATILIPEKVTFIPTFFFYIKVVHWQGTIYPLIVYLFFGSPVYIFLLRQNFKSIPIELEESAMLDGAGPLRRLYSIILPQSWPAIITIALLQFFYTWNETRLASLYLGTNSHFMPVSFGVQIYQSLVPIQNVIEAGSVVVMVIPVLVLILSQRLFMRSMTITGMEKR